MLCKDDNILKVLEIALLHNQTHLDRIEPINHL